MPEMICPQCGGTFIKKCRGKQRFCSAKCRGKYKNAEKTYLEKTANKSKKSAAGSSIAEVSRLARAANMTYGQYVATMKI